MRIPKVSLYRRVKKEGKGYRYVRVNLGRGRRPADLEPPYYLRHTNERGKQQWTFVSGPLGRAIEEKDKFQAVLEAKAMRLTPSDFFTYHRPSRCDLRVFLRHRQELEEAPTPYDEVMRRLGLRHEQGHLATLGAFTDVRDASLHEQVRKTAKAIAKRVPVIYQGAFLVTERLGESEVEIVGIPDFLILDGDGYVIRDSKMSRRIDEENHPEILLQVSVYGWLYERSCGSPPRALQVHCGTGEVVTIPYDGGAVALQELKRLLELKQLPAEPYEPVGWSKCLGCGFTDRCWSKAERDSDVALVYGVDQNLARTLNAQGIRTRRDLLTNFNVESLSEFRRPYGEREQRVTLEMRSCFFIKISGGG